MYVQISLAVFQIRKGVHHPVYNVHNAYHTYTLTYIKLQFDMFCFLAGLGQEQASQQPPEVAANNGMNGGATHAQKPTGTAAKAAAHAQQPQLNGHASAATSPAAVGAAQASSSGLLDDRLKSSIPPPRSGLTPTTQIHADCTHHH